MFSYLENFNLSTFKNMYTHKRLYILAFLLLMLTIWIIMPVIAIDFPIVLIIGFIVILAAFYFFTKSLDKTLKFGVPITLACVGIIYGVVTSPIMHSNSYHQLLGEVKTSDFNQQIEPVDLDKIRIVDQDFANKLGSKELGNHPALGSRAELGTMNIQNVNGKLYWVGPIEHTGFFKWFKFDYTPGYVMVSATNPQDVEMKLGYIIKYQPSAYFKDDLKRHLYLSGYINNGLTDFSFEIDDEGKPHYVVTMYEHAVGFSGENAIGILIVDPETGDIEEYTISEAPTWVDRIQPEDIIMTQLEDWGQYNHGWVNKYTSKEGMLKPTPELQLVYSNGQSYWYSGLSSYGSDESTVGFVLINTRTKEVFRFEQPGATEVAAMQSAQGKVQEKGYLASYPVPYNISGIPTYVIPLKDASGLVKLISMVSVEDYSIVGDGVDLRSALREYKSALSSRGNALVPSSGSTDIATVTGVIERFGLDVRGSVSFYSFMIDQKPDTIFVATSSVSPEVPVTKVGDNVTVMFLQNEIGVIDVSNFDNLQIDLATSNKQKEANKNFNEVK